MKSKGYVRFLKPYKLNDRSFEKDDIIGVDELQLSRDELRMLLSEKYVLPCDTRAGITHGGPVSMRTV
jgi:hypothetical protein